MPGGLVQLAVYGSQDIFLTASPQITFFKIVYRKYTNFACESISQYFIGQVDFDQEISMMVDKIGDLMGQVYLEIDLPKVDLLKNPCRWHATQSDIKNKLTYFQKFYDYVIDYLLENITIIKKIHELLKINNINPKDIKHILNNSDFIQKLNIRKHDLQKYLDSNLDLSELIDFKINQIDIVSIFNSIYESIDRLKISVSEKEQLVRRKIIVMIESSLYQDIHQFYFHVVDVYQSYQKKYYSLLDGSYYERHKFAWVEEIGHAIIDKIEIKIGNQVIDRHTGDWLTIFNKLYLSHHQFDVYHKMIGNVSDLTIFDDDVKNNYKIIIPFRFWFCQNTGSSLPLISLKYHDVMFNVKFKDLSKLCYVDDEMQITDISTVQAQYNINLINAKLHIDYIFLDTVERKRFAESTHEYLIETVQYNEYDNINSKQFKINVDFNNPTKFIVWFLQPSCYRENTTGKNKCQWNNFAINPDKSGQTLDYCHLAINLCDIIDQKIDMKYFNYVHPYLYFNHSPNDGLYTYSFAIKPLQHQPSGCINFSRIDDFSLTFTLSEGLVNLMNFAQKSIYAAVYGVSYNILRIIGGMAGLAFQNSDY